MSLPTHTVKIPVNVELPEKARTELLRMINLHHVGDVDVNRYVNGRLVSKFKEKETQALLDAHYNIHADRQMTLALTFDANGNVVDAQVL